MEVVYRPIKIVPGVFIENNTSVIHVLPEGFYFPKCEFDGVSGEVHREFINRLLSLYKDSEYRHRVCTAWKAGNTDSIYTATKSTQKY